MPSANKLFIYFVCDVSMMSQCHKIHITLHAVGRPPCQRRRDSVYAKCVWDHRVNDIIELRDSIYCMCDAA